ncbi:MAG: hypothetical protein ABI662_12605 [Dermatophilaceae bacterium]
MPDSDIDREEHQYALMGERIDQFRAGEISIAPAIADLEGLLNALEHAADDWRDAFIEEWSVLEVAYAVALDSLEPLPTAADHDIADALSSLERHISQRHG